MGDKYQQRQLAVQMSPVCTHKRLASVWRQYAKVRSSMAARLHKQKETKSSRWRDANQQISINTKLKIQSGFRTSDSENQPYLETIAWIIQDSYWSCPEGIEVNDKKRTMVVTGIFFQEISQETASNGLWADDKDILLPFQLHDDWFQTTNQILIWLKHTMKPFTLPLLG